MDFIKEVSSCPTLVHEGIYSAALRITSLELSLFEIEKQDRDMAKSCTAFYHFIRFFYSDMYDYPDEYDIRAGEWEVYASGRKLAYLLRHDNINAIENRKTIILWTTYKDFIYELAVKGTLEENKLVFSIDEYNNFLQYWDETRSYKKNLKNFMIPYIKRINALKRVGLQFNTTNNQIEVINTTFPDMFKAMSVLAKNALKFKPFGIDNFFNCEFRQILGKYNPKYEDYIQPLDSKSQQICSQIHDFFKARKARPSIKSPWKIRYDLHNYKMVQMNLFLNHVELSVELPQQPDLDIVMKEDKLFEEFIMKNLNYCTACSPNLSHELGEFHVINGKKKRLCVYSLKIRKLTEYHMPFVFRILYMLESDIKR